MNSGNISIEKAPNVSSLSEMETVIGQSEETLGPLVVIESNSTETFFSFDQGRERPATLVVLEEDTGQPSGRAGSDELVARGVCIIAGAPVSVAAYRAVFRGVQTVSNEIPPEGRALLDTIAGTESPGYDVIYGGRRFTDFSHHPNIRVTITSGPNKGNVSTAAGRYQFVIRTWTNEQKQLNLPDFSPQSQDKAAWHLAQTVYHNNTNRDLGSDLKNGILDKVGPALHGTWTSLPGGIEQGVNANRFVVNYNKNLVKYKTPLGGPH
jgi:muramidase (phage lysozyme)